MGFREILNSSFSDKESLVGIRYKTTKFIFMFAALCFFINFALLGANIYFDVSIRFFPFTYGFFLFSLFYYLYFLFKIKISSNLILNVIVYCLLLVVFLLLFLPFVFPKGLGYFVDILSLFS